MLNDFSKLIESVDQEVKKADKNYVKAKESAEEIAASAAASPSQAGDRYHSQGTADIAKQKLNNILSLEKELEEKKEKVCFEHQGEIVYVVDNPVLITGFKIISSNSPLGKKILKSK